MLKILSKFSAATLGILLATSFWTVQAGVVFDHTFPENSVDGNEIRYGGTTKYTSHVNFSVNLWNTMGKINILPDTAFTVQDLTYSDVYSSEVYTAVYSRTYDTIKFNTRYMDETSRSTASKNKTAAHELGHALGIADHYDSLYSTIIMYGYSSEENTLKTHDKADYYINW